MKTQRHTYATAHIFDVRDTGLTWSKVEQSACSLNIYTKLIVYNG